MDGHLFAALLNRAAIIRRALLASILTGVVGAAARDDATARSKKKAQEKKGKGKKGKSKDKKPDPYAPVPCTSSRDCFENQYCRNKVCTNGCLTDDTCSPEAFCQILDGEARASAPSGAGTTGNVNSNSERG